MAVGFQGADPAQLRRLGAQMGSSGRMLLAQLGRRTGEPAETAVSAGSPNGPF